MHVYVRYIYVHMFVCKKYVYLHTLNQARAGLVSWNCFCPGSQYACVDVCVCVSAPEAMNN